MRFMMMHKNDPQTEAGHPPPPELIQQMGAFIGEFARTGRLIDGAGLRGSQHRTRLTFRDGQVTTKHGPYAGARELPSATLQLKVQDLEQALGWAERYGKILGDCELEVGKVTEPWDLGVMPKPENPPLQVLLIEKADEATEGRGRSSQQKAALARLRTEMTKAGVLVRNHRLGPSAQGKRLTFAKGHLSVVDGPFAESKELLGGFAVLDLSGMDEVLEMAKRYATILGGTLEMDLRTLGQDEE